MLKYVSVMSDASVRYSCTFCFARNGASLPLGAAMLTKSYGTSHATSDCLFRNDSQRGCTSSMIEISTRSIIGSLRPLNFASSA